MKTIYLFEAEYGYSGKRKFLVQSTSRFAAEILLEKEHPIVRDIEFIEAFDNLITNGMEVVAGLKDFKADFGFGEPIRTKAECSNPEFHDHKLHRVAIMKDEHFGSKGDRDEGGVAGWTSKLVCVGCGMEFQGQNGFYLDKKEQVDNE